MRHDLQLQMLHFVKSHSLWNWMEGLWLVGTRLLIKELDFTHHQRHTRQYIFSAYSLGSCVLPHSGTPSELVMRRGEILESISKMDY